MTNLFLIVPVYNEANNVERLLDAFRQLIQQFAQYEMHIIMVDDGSQDNTSETIKQFQGTLPITVLPHDVNQGPGKAFATAFSYLAEHMQAEDWVITIEGDNTSRHELIQTMMRRAIEEDYDVVFASPYLYGGGVVNTTSLRVILSKIANTFVKELLGITGLVTVSSFFRLYRASVIQQLQREYGMGIVESTGFECMVEMTIKMINLCISISEVPMVLDTSLRAGKSKMKILNTIRGYVSLYPKRNVWQRTCQDNANLIRP